MLLERRIREVEADQPYFGLAGFVDQCVQGLDGMARQVVREFRIRLKGVKELR